MSMPNQDSHTDSPLHAPANPVDAAQDSSNERQMQIADERSSLAPLIAYICITMLVVMGLAALLDWTLFHSSTSNYAMTHACIMGGTLGALAFCVVVVAIFGRSWLVGLWSAIALLLIGITMWWLGGTVYMWLREEFYYTYSIQFEGPTIWATSLILPLAFVIIALPLLAMRYFRGWRLYRGELKHIPPAGLEGLIWATTVSASLLILARAPMLLYEYVTIEFWAPFVISTFLLAVVATIVGPVSVRCAFSDRRSLATRAFRTYGFVLLAVSLLWGGTTAFAVFATGDSPVSDVAGYTGFIFGLSIPLTLIYSSGLLALSLSGFRLATNKQLRLHDQNTSQTDPLAETDEITPETRPVAIALTPIWQTRILSLVLLAISGIVSGAVAITVSQRAAMDDRWAQVSQELASKGGGIAIENRQVTRIDFPTSATDADVADLLEDSLERLSFTGSQIGNPTLARVSQLHNLTRLDISHTKIDDTGLQQLHNLAMLEFLSVSGTQITPTGLSRLLQQVDVFVLELGGLDWSLEQIDSIPLDNIQSLSLRGLPITDEWVSEFLRFESGMYLLDLSDTDVTGSFLATEGLSIDELNLNGTQVTDAVLAEHLAAGVVNKLSVDRTRVTAMGIASIVPFVQQLTFGETEISEDEIVKHAAGYLTHLGLNATKFSGESFSKWTGDSMLSELDMSDSGISDATIAHIRNLKGLNRLSLARTAVTDDCLELICELDIGELDISGTEITAAGLAKTQWHDFGLWRLFVGYGQFSQEELKQLSEQISIEVGKEMFSADDFY